MKAQRLFVVLALVLIACHKKTSIKQGGTQGTTENPDLPTCSQDDTAPGTHGPDMVHVGLLDQTCFWIDSTEVSREQYAEFLDAVSKGDASAADGCDTTDFTTTTCETESAIPVSLAPDHPIVCVDWCMAASYCAWAGKTLCSGGTGTKVNDAKYSQWYSACSTGDQNVYPYGDDLDTDACNIGDTSGTGCLDAPDACSTVAVGHKSCATESKVYDLSGNVGEWVNECSGSECNVRGGSYAAASGEVTCESVDGMDKDKRRFDVGFRCCAAEVK